MRIVNLLAQCNRILAFTLVEIMIVVAILGLVISIAVPYYVRQRADAQANICINGLLKLDDAACEFALERGKKTGDTINFPADLTPYLKLNSNTQIPGCPAGGIYSVAIVGVKPSCSIGTSVNPAPILP
jgi:prepilin-type N-terminal cleavage/methylation domain-containing protein